MDTMERLIAFIIARRHELGYSQRDLARKAGLNAGTISSIEAGKVTRAPTIRTLQKLAKGLEVASDVLIDMVRGGTRYPDQAAQLGTMVVREDTEALDSWERSVLEKIDTFDLTTFAPQHGRLLWQLDRASRRRVLRHLEGLWEEAQEFLKRGS